MAWRALTEDDILTSSKEDTALRALLLRPGQEDPQAVVIRQVTGEFRSAIRSGPNNRLPADITLLPEVAIYHAAAIVRFRLITRFPTAQLMTDDRRREQKDAMDWLNLVRTGKELIEPPDGQENDTSQNSGTVEVVTAEPKQWGRYQQRRL